MNCFGFGICSRIKVYPPEELTVRETKSDSFDVHRFYLFSNKMCLLQDNIIRTEEDRLIHKINDP